MILCKFGFVILLCIIFQSNGNICSIIGCNQNSPSDILQENLFLTTRVQNCMIARNYDELSFSVVINNTNYQSCFWIFAQQSFNSNNNCIDYSGNANPFNQEGIFTSFVSCTNRSINRTDVKEITCVMDNGKNYSSIVFARIPYNDLFVAIQCDDIYSKGFHIRVRPCNKTFGQQGNQVYVDSNSSDYNAAGSFRCDNNGRLFNSNATLVRDNSTRCLANAQWKGQENVQCWKAPSVLLKGNYDWVNESILFLDCDYNDGFPAGNKSIFYVNKTAIAVLPKGEMFNLTVNRTNDKASVQCQAHTSFTQKYNETGRSNESFLNVLFAPYPLQQRCLWNQTTEFICKFQFFSNPNASVVSLFEEDRNFTKLANYSLTILEDHEHIFVLNINESLKRSSVIYNLTVRSIFQPYSHHILFTINDSQTISTTTTTYTLTTTSTENSFDLIKFVLVPLLAVLLVVAIIVCVFIKWKKKKKQNIADCTQDPSGNEIEIKELYVSQDTLQNNGIKPSTDETQQARNKIDIEVPYGVVNKPKKKPLTTGESSEKEERLNELYVSTDMLDNKESSEKEERFNDLYVSTDMLDNNGKNSSTDKTQDGDKIEIEVAYGVVNKPKKKQKKADNKKKSTDNVDGNSKDLYQTADLTKKKKKAG